MYSKYKELAAVWILLNELPKETVLFIKHELGHVLYDQKRKTPMTAQVLGLINLWLRESGVSIPVQDMEINVENDDLKLSPPVASSDPFLLYGTKWWK